MAINYHQFVITAETQVKFDHMNGGPKFSVSLYLAGSEWKLTVYPQNHTLELEFKGFREDMTRIHMEVLLCDENFHPFGGFPKRQMLTIGSATWSNDFSVRNPAYRQQQYAYLIIRLLRERFSFPSPDFTSPHIQFGHLKSNGKLRVNNCIFHVNKELLSCFSPYFQALYSNPMFVEAERDEVELKGATETSNPPALFHDFLLTMLPNQNFLPNVKNVAGLLALAHFYQVDCVRDKCESHLKNCREMPVRERFALAEQYGLKSLLSQMILEQNAS